MSTFDTLKGINNFADMDLGQIIAGSYIEYLSFGLLDKGAFNSVKLNSQDIYGGGKSVLRSATDSDYNNGQVFECFHSNLVWESGLSSVAQPLMISGTYINNTFYPLSTIGPFAHHIEYTTGRVIFTNPIPVTSNVQLEYSYKQVAVVEAKDFPELRTIQFRTFDPANNNFSLSDKGDYNRNPNDRIALPLIAVETTPQIKMVPYELGNFSQRVDVDINFHVLGENDAIVKKLITILSLQKEATTFLLNMDAIARSGVFALNETGQLNPGAQTYRQLVNNPEFQLMKSFIYDVTGQTGSWVSNTLFHGSVQFKTENIY